MNKFWAFGIVALALAVAIVGTVFAGEQIASRTLSENGWMIFAYSFEIFAIIFMVFMAFISVHVFAKEFKIAEIFSKDFVTAEKFIKDFSGGMRIIAFGLIIVSINILLRGLSDFEVILVPIKYNSLLYHFFGVIGFAIMAWGFTSLYNIVENISGRSLKRPKKGIKKL